MKHPHISIVKHVILSPPAEQPDKYETGTAKNRYAAPKKIVHSTFLTSTKVGSRRFFALPTDLVGSLRSGCLSGRRAQNDGCFYLPFLCASIFSCLLLLGVSSCSNQEQVSIASPAPNEISVVVLGTIQDAGSPQVGCMRKCCQNLFTNPDPSRQVVSLGLIDRENSRMWMIEATPDFTSQVRRLNVQAGTEFDKLPDGIFLTHAHIGHYSGLMYLGKEAIGSSEVPVYAMPRMKLFLEENGPWSQLVSERNIEIQVIEDGVPIQLSANIVIIPFSVPHRDEFSETVGYRVAGPDKTLLFIPDIDKWSEWQTSIIKEIQKVDYAFLDATFYDGNELNNRDMSEIPHPFVVESMALLKDLSPEDKSKVYFIHFNHTNPLIDESSPEYASVLKNGFKVAEIGQMINL